MELQLVDNLPCLLGQSVFLHQWEHGTLDGSEGCGQFQDCTCLAVFELFLLIAVANDAEEHTVDTAITNGT